MKPEQTAMILRSALTRSEIAQLTQAVSRAINSGIFASSYIFIEDQSSSIINKIKSIAEQALNSRLLYLNDFYLYTDGTFQTDWHIDTEMFSFGRAINVWIPLDDSIKRNPIAFISRINDRDDNYFHSITRESQNYEFMNLVSFDETSCSISAVEDSRLLSGDVSLGDILILNPNRFHRTNSGIPKHAFIAKFIVADDSGLQSPQMVPSVVWPEVALFEPLTALQDNWPHALDTIRTHLADPEKRAQLTAGFFPNQLDLFRQKIADLIADQAGGRDGC